MKITIHPLKKIFLIGDTHGDWREVLYKMESGAFDNSVMIHVGDVGMGFPGTIGCETELDRRFAEREIICYGIRGNHDDPTFFTGDTRVDLPNFKLIPDYTVITHGEHTIQLVGGALSIDRVARTDGLSYWSDEGMIYDESKAVKCDVLITHTAPNWIGPNDRAGVSYWLKKDHDPDFWSVLCNERLECQKLINKTSPSRHYCGHFHVKAEVEKDGVKSRILDIAEITPLIYD